MQSDPNGGTTATEEQLRDTIEDLSGRSEAELFDALREETEKGRADGSLDNTRMDEIYELLSPMLTEAQRTRMQHVLERLKE